MLLYSRLLPIELDHLSGPWSVVVEEKIELYTTQNAQNGLVKANKG